MSNAIQPGEFSIGGRRIGRSSPALVVAEIGINHEGDLAKAYRMVDDAKAAGCECVKFQSHVIEDEMIPEAGNVIPGNASESILEIMKRCAFDEVQEAELKRYVEDSGMLFLSTPFSRAAADRLERMGVLAYKIGSGECNNYPLIEHIASFGKPVILSTGMNNIETVRPAVEIFRDNRIPYVLLHVTSMYPTPYDKVRLGAMRELQEAFPDAQVGLSDHTLTNYTCLAAAALGATVLERHFTSDKSWPGPDIEVSMDPRDLKDLIEGSRAIHLALGGSKRILPEEQPTIDFAYACVVALRDIDVGETLGMHNIWVKRPGTGEILAKDFKRLLGRKAAQPINRNEQLRWEAVA
ncbi:MAG: N-acetylneuraminate synthase family protein [Ramlibacter sp.]